MSELMGEENEKQQKKTSATDVAQKSADTAKKVKQTAEKIEKAQKAAKAAKAGKTVAGSGKILTALAPVLPYIGIALLVILIIMFLIGIIVFLLTMPGMVMEQLKAMFHELGSKVAAFFGEDTTQQIENEQIYEILDYLEDMGYSLKGYGFLTEFFDESDAGSDFWKEAEKEFDEEGKADNGVIRGVDSGKIIGAQSEFIFTYIMSDNYVYTVKNFNVVNEAANREGFWSNLWGGIVALGQKLAGIFVDEGAIWGRGMIYLEDKNGNEWQNGLKWGWPIRYEEIYIDVASKKMLITRGAFANAFEFDMQGWTGRYGMPVEFLLSVHIASNMPDLAYDMVSFFGTEVVIRMSESTTDAKSAYKEKSGKMVQYEPMLATKEDGWFFADDWILSNEEAYEILAFGLESPDTCENSPTCSADSQAAEHEYTECCDNCKNHVDKVMKAARDPYEKGMVTYTPYIRKVKDHWYRDVFFELDSGEKADGILIDEEYEVFMDERWTDYHVYPDTDDLAGNTIWFILGKDGNFLTDESQVEDARTVMEDTLPVDTSKVASMSVDDRGTYVYYHVETAKEAREVGLSVARMARTEEIDGGWSAYDDHGQNDSSGWVPAYPDTEDEYKKNVFVQTTTTGGKKQIEEGIRGVTNEKIKRIFAVNTYFRYDGNPDTAEIIYALRHDNDLGYGNLNGDEGGDSIYNSDNSKGSAETLAANLEKQATVAVGNTTEEKTYKVKDYAAQLDLTKDSLAAFSMLENTHTQDADYIYRDFKELIVELGYFEKQELAESVPEIFEWFIPEIGSYGYPIRHADKKENLYGTLAHSYDDYKALQQLSVLSTISNPDPTRQEGTGAYRVSDVVEDEIDEEEPPVVSDSSNVNTQDYTKSDDLDNGKVPSGKKGTSAALVTLDEFLKTTREMCEYINAEGYDYCVYEPSPEKEGAGDYRAPCTCKNNADCMAEYNKLGRSWICNATGCSCETNHCKHNVHENDCGLPTTFEASKAAGKHNFCCATLVSWALQNVEVMPDEDHLDGAETLANYVENVLGAQRIEKTEELEEGDILVYFGHVDLVGERKDGGFVKYNGGHHVPVGAVEGQASDVRKGGSCIEHITGWPEKAEYALRLNWGGKEEGVYEGYRGSEAVVSPATGILLEYGEYEGLKEGYSAINDSSLIAVGNAHQANRETAVEGSGAAKETIAAEDKGDRLNYDLKYPVSGMSGAGMQADATKGDATAGTDATLTEIKPRDVYDKVGYAKILVLNDDYFKKLEEHLGTPFGESLQLKSGYKDYTSITQEEIREWTEEQIDLYGYKEFIEKYDEFDLEGYIIYIDGFECELPNPSFDPEDPNSDPRGDTKLSMTYFKSHAKDYAENLYEVPDLYQLSSQEATDRRKAEEEVKCGAHPLIKVGNDLFIKEGTVIGRTRTDKETVEARGETYTPPPNQDELAKMEAEGKTYQRTVVGNYIRIVMRDRDDTVVENVEGYLKLDEMVPMPELEMEKFLYWMGVYVEGGHKYQSGGQWMSKAVDLNDGVGATHFFGLTHYCKPNATALGYTVGNWGDDQPMEMLVNVYLARIEEDKQYVQDELGQDIPDGYLQAFISIKHNYGNLTKRGDEYKSKGEVSENTWTTYEGTQYAEALTKRRISEWMIITEGRYTECYSDPYKDLVFESETPFTDWCKELGITNITIGNKTE